MKISLCSDLHLEWGYQELPGGDVLILSGDIAEARSIDKDNKRATPLVGQPNVIFPCSEFFKWECSKYEKVFYVLGNHEHYHWMFNETLQDLRELMPKNVTILEKEVCEYKGIMFMGATLWTDLGNRNPLAEYHLKTCMKDYTLITYHNSGKNVYHKLSPLTTFDEHVKTLEYFKIMLSEHNDKPFVIMTHHAPSWQSIHEKYKHDSLMNMGYVSDLDQFIIDNPNIKIWTHGHVHNRFDYMIGDSRILCNPRGYISFEQDHGFDPEFTFEV